MNTENNNENQDREHRPYNNQNSDYRREGNNSYPKRNYNSNGGGGNFQPRRNYDNNGGGNNYPPKRNYDNNGNAGNSTYPPRRNYDNNGGGNTYPPKRNYDNNNRNGFSPRPNFTSRPQQNRNLPDDYGNRWENNRGSSGDQQQQRPYRNNNYNSYNRQEGGNRPNWQQRQDGNSGGYQQRPRWNNNNHNNGGGIPTRNRWEKQENSQNFVETRFDGQSNYGSVKFRKPRSKTDNFKPGKRVDYPQEYVDPTKPLRLNKYLANTGICSRREADEYITAGVITVNGEVVTALGTKILPTDKVMFHDQPIQSERKVYILLNKPKDCVTTTEDANAKKTVMDIVRTACSERIYPVGRLDRNTTGVLLLTNDGDLASKLAHPKYDKKKIYHVGLDKPLEEEHFKQIMLGIELEDGTIAADALEYVKESQTNVGIEIHSGKNRIVRRIFDKLGYKVKRLDRVYFAGMTKKNLPRGKYRFLSEKEVAFLKMNSFV